MTHDGKIDVVVKYPATGDELKDANAKRTEPLASLKERVLTAFGLKEKEGEKIRRFVFFHDGAELTDLAKTLSEVAGDQHTLRLELAKERYFFFYKGMKIFSSEEVATGTQIKAMIKAVEPTFDLSQNLFYEIHDHHDHEDVAVPDGAPVSLEVGEAHPVKHFYSKPPTTFGM